MGDTPMKAQIEQTIIVHLQPSEAAWLKQILADPPSSEELPYDQKRRIELHDLLFQALEEVNY
jgi:hypothetical protein